MIKQIYGFFDSKTKNFGDICLLDRDEDFREGCIDLLSNPEIPQYLVFDMLGLNYGYITCDSDDPYPVFHIHDCPRIVISGSSPMVACRRHDRIEQSSDTDDDSFLSDDLDNFPPITSVEVLN